MTTFHGRVVDELGKPLVGAAVRLAPRDDFVDTAELLAKPAAVTGPDGRYGIEPLADLTWGTVVVAAQGRQTCAFPFHGETSRDLRDVVLMPGARISGRVRNDRGVPLAGARVRVVSAIDERFAGGPRLFAGARSDAKGIFSVPCVPRTGLRLIVEADGHLTESWLVAQDSAVDVTLPEVGMVRGKVVDAAGKPVAGITVSPRTVEHRFSDGKVRSGPDGTFAVTVPSRGRFRLSAALDAPVRWLSSGLLRGPADDVVVAPVSGTSAQTLKVTVVDAATKAPLPRFHLSVQHVDSTQLQTALFHHSVGRRAFEREAAFEVPRDPGRAERPLVLVVDAPGHAFEVVPVPARLDAPVTVALGPEAVLVGRVTDAGTGKPMAGVAVRALPKGDSNGSGGTAEDAGPRSDADGNYRIGGLRAGVYDVQTCAAQRGTSAALQATVQVGTETRLDVTVPKEEWLEIEFTGAVPAGVAYSLSVRMTGSVGGLQHVVPPPAPVPLTKAGHYRIGPVIPGTAELQLFAPSRTRIGSGTTIPLGTIATGTGPTPIALPDLTLHMLQGAIELPADVPKARIAVIAALAGTVERQRPAVAGVGGDGQFTIDLPAGTYCLQCVDLQTGIVFHTEEDDVVVGATTAKVSLRPTCRWLDLDARTKPAGAEALLQSFHVVLNRPRGGSAFLHGYPGGGPQEIGFFDCRGGAQQRWLVPAGPIEVRAMQSFGMLEPGSSGHRSTEVARANLDVDQREQRLVLEVPAPPSDEEIMKRRKD